MNMLIGLQNVENKMIRLQGFSSSLCEKFSLRHCEGVARSNPPQNKGRLLCKLAMTGEGFVTLKAMKGLFPHIEKLRKFSMTKYGERLLRKLAMTGMCLGRDAMMGMQRQKK